MEEREDLILQPVPLSERIGWKAPLFNVLGTNIAISALMVGSTLITGLTLKDLIWVSILGNLILMAILIIQGNIGSREGVNTYVIAKGAFGEIGGTWIISLILGITSFGWFGIQAGVAGLSIKQIFPNINLTLIVIIIGILMVVVAAYGFNTMALFNYIAIPPLIVLIVWALIKAIDQGGGMSPVLDYTPENPMTMIKGIDIVVGLIIVGAVISPDYLRYTRGMKDVVIVGFIAVALVTFFQQVAAGIMSVNALTTDITEVLKSLGFNWVAFVVLILAAWSTNLANAYSGGLALKNIFPNVKRIYLTLIAGSVGIILAAFNIISVFQGFLSFLSMTVSAIAGVIWVEYYLVQKKKLVIRKGIHWLAIFAWIGGVVAAYLSSKWGFGIAPINSIIVAGLLYLALEKAFDNKVLSN
ncbi:cytosine permease [Virgibacillus pantothenticus]|uniref:cytosine permease n=1 Tax=Virgibacillus pantothenticus TaxID=1473 RepID=UPI0009846367|nr:cytosine permease [Virgibacillus pantothenticus]